MLWSRLRVRLPGECRHISHDRRVPPMCLGKQPQRKTALVCQACVSGEYRSCVPRVSGEYRQCGLVAQTAVSLACQANTSSVSGQQPQGKRKSRTLAKNRLAEERRDTGKLRSRHPAIRRAWRACANRPPSPGTHVRLGTAGDGSPTRSRQDGVRVVGRQKRHAFILGLRLWTHHRNQTHTRYDSD